MAREGRGQARDTGKSPNRRQGFTLLELLCALTLAALLANFAWAGFGRLLAVQRQAAAIAELRTLVRFARFSAISGQHRVTVCALDPGGRCRRDWTGRRVVVFGDVNNNRRLDSGEAVMRDIGWHPARGQLRWRASLGRPYLAFTAQGRAVVNGSFRYCPADNDPRLAVALVVSHTGRVYVPGDSDGDGIGESAAGDRLDCPP
jgi:type IV fimbrial biogenesis protein FimT